MREHGRAAASVAQVLGGVTEAVYIKALNKRTNSIVHAPLGLVCRSTPRRSQAYDNTYGTAISSMLIDNIVKESV